MTGNDCSYITALVSQLRMKFDMIDLGALKYFWGLEVTHSTTGV